MLLVDRPSGTKPRSTALPLAHSLVQLGVSTRCRWPEERPCHAWSKEEVVGAGEKEMMRWMEGGGGAEEKESKRRREE